MSHAIMWSQPVHHTSTALHDAESARVAIALRNPSASLCVLRPTTMSTPTADGHSDAGLGSWVDTDGRSDAGLTSWADVQSVITEIGLT